MSNQEILGDPEDSRAFWGRSEKKKGKKRDRLRRSALDDGEPSAQAAELIIEEPVPRLPPPDELQIEEPAPMEASAEDHEIMANEGSAASDTSSIVSELLSLRKINPRQRYELLFTPKTIRTG